MEVVDRDEQRGTDAGVARRARDEPGRSGKGRGQRDAEAVMIRLAALTRSWQDLDDVKATVEAIVAAAVDTIPGATHAGLSVASQPLASAIVATDEVVSRLAQAQQDTGEGPALTSFRQGRTVRVDDLSAPTPWPGFAARAVQAGVGSILAVPLSVHRGALGVLSLSSHDPYAFDDGAERIAEVFAAHAAVALAGAQAEQHLSTALATRDVIGQAKGVLMERYRLSAQQAFAALKHASQNTNTKLVDVAQTLLRTGTLTGATPEADHRHDSVP